MKNQSILKGTAILTTAALVVKLLGAAYRIPLARLIGSEGIGLYQMAYPIYLIFLSLSTAGIPMAVSRIIASALARNDLLEVKRVFRASLILMFLLGLVGASSMALAAPWLARHVVADPRAVYGMWALAPAIFFMSMMAALRGYFQGWQIMTPSAVSQIVEQVVRVAVALILAVVLLKTGIEHASAGAAFGATAGGAAGLTFLAITIWREQRRRLKVRRPLGDWRELLPVAKKLWRYALPISLAVVLMPVLQTLDSIIVPAKLQSIGYTTHQATAMLGILGNSWAVLYLPLIVTTAMAANLVPAIAGLKAMRRSAELIQKIQEGLRLALIYLVPSGVALAIFGKTMYFIIYGLEGIAMLSWLAPAVVFLGLEQVSAGILQGLGKPNQPLVNFIIGAITKILVTVFATSWPGLNLAGAALGTVCGSGITAFLNLLSIKYILRLKFHSKLAVMTSGLAMLAVCWYLKRLLQLHFVWEILLVGLSGLIMYFGILWLLGGIGGKDLEVVTKILNQRSFQHD